MSHVVVSPAILGVFFVGVLAWRRQGSQWDKAVSLMREARADGVEIDAAAHDCVIGALGKVGWLVCHVLFCRWTDDCPGLFTAMPVQGKDGTSL